MRRPWIIAIIILIVIIGIVFIRFTTKKRESETVAVASTVKVVEVIKASRGEIRSELQFSGTIEADSQVTVFPEVAGKIIKMNVDEGDRVEKGQTLVVIEHEELELQVRQAEAAYQAADTTFDQAQKLAEVRIRSQIYQAQAQLASAVASFRQVEELAETRTISQLEQAKAGLQSLKANLEKIKRGARDEDRRQAEAAVNQANANLANAKSNYNRMKKLFENNAVSEQSIEAAETQLDVAKAQYEVAREQMRLIENGAREEDIRALEAQVAGAEAAFKLAYAQADTKTWEKDRKLAEAQVMAARAVLEAAEALKTARSWEAEITSAETAVAQAEAALNLAQKRLADARVTAPIAGVVSMRALDLGGMAVPTTPIFEIVDMDAVKAVVSVIESDLGKVRRGDSAWIQVDAAPQPVSGKISHVSPTLDRTSRSAKLEITIDNADLRLKPGMFAKVSIPVEIHENAILIPRSAVIEDSVKNVQTVFVVADGHGKRRQIEFGLTEGSNVEITSGLSEGEQVVIAGQHTLKDGEEVSAVNP